MLEAVSRFEPLPTEELVSKDDADVERTFDRINGVYPWLAASSIRATIAASEFRPIDKLRCRPVRHLLRLAVRFVSPAANSGGAAERGSLTHRILQHMDFTIATDSIGVANELDRIVSEGTIILAQRRSIMEDGIAWFAATPLADIIRKAGADYRREFRFVTTEPLDRFDPTVTASEVDRVLVRGIVDGIVVREGECEIVDFKTDAVSALKAAARSETHRPQMELYARAVERLWHRPVRTCHLVFLTARCVVEVPVGVGQALQ
jgi:ATP-dependent helicase/nuclease subunit A